MAATPSNESSRSAGSRTSSNASSARRILEMEGYDASQAHIKALQAQDVAKDKEEAERLARKMALYVFIARGRQRAKRVVTAVLQAVNCF